jgi:phage baseplate assembly protein W
MSVVDTQRAKLFGRDIWFDTADQTGADTQDAANGDWLLAEEKDALRQAVIRRIITSPGEWRTLPDYGVGARAYVKARNTRAVREELAGRIKQQLLREPRIASISSISVSQITGGLKIAVRVIARGRTLSSTPLDIIVEL